jgi:hypothetical protein
MRATSHPNDWDEQAGKGAGETTGFSQKEQTSHQNNKMQPRDVGPKARASRPDLPGMSSSIREGQTGS